MNTKAHRTLLTTIIAILVSSCVPTPPPFQGNPDDIRVLFHGDSLSYMADRDATGLDPLPSLLTQGYVEAGYQASVIAVIGQDTPAGTAMVEQWEIEIPDVAVIALGGNDIHKVHEGTVGMADIFNDMNNYLQALDGLGVECIVWVETATHLDDWGFSTFGPYWNQFLGAHPLIDHVQPWVDTAVGLHTQGLYDSVHFDIEAAPIYRQTLLEAATRCDT